MTANDALRDFEEDARELDAILETMADGMFVLDANRRVRRWNRAMERLTGFSAEETRGKPCHVLNWIEKGGGDAAYCGLFAMGAIDRLELNVARKDGSVLPVLVSARVMTGAEGKPCGAVVTVTDVSTLKRLESEVTELRREVEGRYEFHNLVGRSPAMRKVFALAELAAASMSGVLILGETGTGKELLAKAIHYHSDRRAAPLISVNCAALSEGLVESELFGHVRGAFTGALKDYVGRFERAHGGTIFLDEVGEVPPAVQVKLLRVLQEREVERVGDARPRKVDVRVIAATHRDLREQVARGRFREDLYYRLKVFPILLPSLRERREDVVTLAEHFVARFNERTGKRITGFAPEAMRLLLDYPWPGNVRELENAVEHAFVTCPSGEIDAADLPAELRRVEWPRPALAPSPGPRQRPADRDQLLEALEAAHWNKAEAARRLGITRTHLWRRMKQAGIPLEKDQA